MGASVNDEVGLRFDPKSSHSHHLKFRIWHLKKALPRDAEPWCFFFLIRY